MKSYFQLMRSCLLLLLSVTLVYFHVGAHQVLSNGRIAFTSDSNGIPQIFTINPDGTDLQQLTTSLRGAQSPTWSPSGSQIAYVDNDSLSISIMNGNGTFVRAIPNTLDIRDLDWSPNGLELIGVSSSDVVIVSLINDAIVSIPLNGILEDAFHEESTWSLDGNQFIFASSGTNPIPMAIDGNPNMDLYISDRSGANISKIDSFNGESFGGVSWINNTQVLFSATMVQNAQLLYGVFKYDLMTEALTFLTDEAETSLSPTISPNGNLIAYVRTQGEIVIMNLDGTNPVTIATFDSSVQDLDWQPVTTAGSTPSPTPTNTSTPSPTPADTATLSPTPSPTDTLSLTPTPPATSTLRIEAESYTSAASGVTFGGTGDEGGGEAVYDFDSGRWVAFNNIDLLGGVVTFRLRADSPASGNLSLRLGSATAAPFCTLAWTDSGGDYATRETACSVPVSGVNTLYLTNDSVPFINVNWLELELTTGGGAPTYTPSPTLSPTPTPDTTTLRIEAETYDSAAPSVSFGGTDDEGGGEAVYDFDLGRWIAFANVDLQGGVVTFRYRGDSAGSGDISLRIGSATATPFCTLAWTPGGTYYTTRETTCSTPVSGVVTLYMTNDSVAWVNTNWIELELAPP
jgi:hypothetical protein